MQQSITLFSTVLAVVMIGVLHTWTVNLAEIDWRICLENQIGSNLRSRVSDMSFQNRMEEILKEPLSHQVVPFMLALFPFLPALFSFTFFKEHGQTWMPILVTTILSVVLLMLLKNPSSMHDCDRKGIDAVFWLAIVSTTSFAVMTIVVAAVIGRIKFFKNIHIGD